MDTQAIIAERVKRFEAAKAIMETAEQEGRSMSGEEQHTFDEHHRAIGDLRQQLDNYTQQLEEEKAIQTALAAHESRGRVTSMALATGQQNAELDQELAFRAWALGGNYTDIAMDRLSHSLRAEMVAACQRVNFNPTTRAIEMPPGKPGEKRALSVGTTDAGGYSVPDEAMRAYWDLQKWFGSMRSVATIWTTATGAPLPVPTTNDTSNTGEIINEGSAVTTTADPVFGQVVLGSFKYSSKAVIVSVELLQDSFLPIPTYLGAKLGTRIGRINNNHFTVGVGTTQPMGIVTAASLGKTAAATNAITWDEVIDLQHSVDIAYRPRAAFMMHDSVAAYLRKLKDSQNRYLWEISITMGQPDRIFGQPVWINNDMSSTFSTNNRLIIYGDFSNYVIRDAGGPIFARADELRILNHQVVFLAFQRSDGNLIDTTSVKYLRSA